MDGKLGQGTAAWFGMVGTLMSEAALRSGLRPGLNQSLVERYVDGVELSEGLVQGIRFDIVDGEPSFRIGARQHERAERHCRGDGSRRAGAEPAAERRPDYPGTRDKFLSTGEMRVDGDPSRLGDWLDALHDRIVDRTI